MIIIKKHQVVYGNTIKYKALNSGVIANFPDKSASFKFKQNITGEK